MTTEELVDSKDETIASAFDDTLMAGFDSIENSIYNAVNKKIMEMNQEDGKIKFDTENLLISANCYLSLLMQFKKAGILKM